MYVLVLLQDTHSYSNHHSLGAPAGGVGRVDPGRVPEKGLVGKEREREHEREARRETDATGNRNTTGEDPTHRGPTQKGGPRRGPTTGWEGHTEDTYRTHTDRLVLVLLQDKHSDSNHHSLGGGAGRVWRVGPGCVPVEGLAGLVLV